ncbi:hypothetical protein M501DRAFT_1010473 [Patellaria atrata CBS 101060]|uniref:CID domain-containing protein n=1 Tax=Patellaria atrata CBS 101060 TaxID=1346257 RepID=A0A9P4SCV9_9PEZI|nr:hypothetical protein M501DRAFT_1010473 [Patellaria atrata CBS 101060]
MSTVADLDGLLRAMLALKPPGVAKAKVEAITKLCIENVQSESVIVQKIFTHSKKTPPTHKLGVLYIVDSVTRQWIEKARSSGQALVGASAAAGTFAAGVHRMTELIPSMMNDLLPSLPENQKEKTSRLLDIWKATQTLPASVVDDYKQKLSSPANTQEAVQPPPAVPQPPAANTDAGSILAALVNMGKQQTNGATQTPSAMSNLFAGQPPNALAPQVQLQPNNYPVPPVASQPAANGQDGNDIANALKLQLAQALISGQVPPEQLQQVLAALSAPAPAAAPSIIQPVSLPTVVPQAPQNVGLGQPDRNDYSSATHNAHIREQNNSPEKHRYRDRSRSPDYKRTRLSPPNRRQSPVYGVYDPDSAAIRDSSANGDSDRRDGNRGRRRGNRQDFRQRSPPSSKARPSPPTQPRKMQQKWIEFDRTLPPGTIKVLSRTLFVGGVMGSESEIRNIFNRFGKIQSCIVNLDRRHAFIKMVDRQGAVVAKEAMDHMTDPEILSKARQTKWAVGFGPRECSDYDVGISIIPIKTLTEADKKWVHTAEYGGIGDRTLESGMVMEEPDIEIGAGVSSKAMSKRVIPEAMRGGRHGNHGNNHGSSHRDRSDNQGSRFRKPEPRHPEPRHVEPRGVEPNIVTAPPAVPTFGFQLPLGNRT